MGCRVLLSSSPSNPCPRIPVAPIVLEFLGDLIGILFDVCLCGLLDIPRRSNDDGDWKPKV